jgi:hypothetical protein
VITIICELDRISLRVSDRSLVISKIDVDVDGEMGKWGQEIVFTFPKSLNP